MKKTLATVALATLVLAGVTSTALAAPVTYAIEPSHTYPRFSYSHFGFSIQQSQFQKTSGKIVYDAEAKTGSMDITIDMNSVETGSDLFNGRIKGEDYFDTAKHPTGTFKSTSVVFDGDKPIAVHGQLTLKGVTKPVVLTVTSFQRKEHPMLKRDTIGANATTTVKRTEFNMGKFAPQVGDDVTITLAVEAVMQ